MKLGTVAEFWHPSSDLALPSHSTCLIVCTGLLSKFRNRLSANSRMLHLISLSTTRLIITTLFSTYPCKAPTHPQTPPWPSSCSCVPLTNNLAVNGLIGSQNNALSGVIDACQSGGIAGCRLRPCKKCFLHAAGVSGSFSIILLPPGRKRISREEQGEARSPVRLLPPWGKNGERVGKKGDRRPSRTLPYLLSVRTRLTADCM